MFPSCRCSSPRDTSTQRPTYGGATSWAAAAACVAWMSGWLHHCWASFRSHPPRRSWASGCPMMRKEEARLAEQDASCAADGAAYPSKRRRRRSTRRRRFREANVGAVLARLVLVSMRLETTTVPGQPNACEAKLVPAAMVGQTRDNTRAISHVLSSFLVGTWCQGTHQPVATSAHNPSHSCLIAAIKRFARDARIYEVLFSHLIDLRRCGLGSLGRA
jgi:hypothetical protein